MLLVDAIFFVFANDDKSFAEDEGVIEVGFWFAFLILIAAAGVIFGGGFFFGLSVPLVVYVTGGTSLLLESVDGLSFVRSPSDMVDYSSIEQI